MYLWLKALHIVALVAWFSGLFYLPRLFVYHTQIKNDNLNYQTSYYRFCTMEYRLYRYIMTPAAIMTTVLGLWLLHSYASAALKYSGWLHAKISLVFFLWMYHLHCGQLVKRFRAEQNRYSEKFYRIYNEIPTILLISIVILAVVKPF